MRRRTDATRLTAAPVSAVRSASIRWLVVIVIAITATGAAAAAPRYMRDMESFRVEHVEVVGTRFMPPDQALAASGITRRSSVFDDPAPWTARLLKHALVQDVRIERSLPATIRIVLRESVPVALVPTPELRPVDARGRLLPIDLSSAPLDLPLLSLLTGTAPNGTISNAGTRRLLHELGRIRSMNPVLAARTSELMLLPDAYRIVLREPAGAEAILPANADALRMREVESALTDLAARGELNALSRIDGRFSDQVVVGLGAVVAKPAAPAPDATVPLMAIQ